MDANVLFELGLSGSDDESRTAYTSRYLLAVPGVGPGVESRLRAEGVTDWRRLSENLHLVPRSARGRAQDHIDLLLAALADEDINALAGWLPRPQWWRLAMSFPSRVLAVDIETTGLSPHYHRLTLIGWGTSTRYSALTAPQFLGGPEPFLTALAESKMLLSFNGVRFDVPFLNATLGGLPWPQAHVDLRHVVRGAGLQGGQKKLEVELGVVRPVGLQEMSGEVAPGLWYQYERGDLGALSKLIEYNYADVAGLFQVLSKVADLREPGIDAANVRPEIIRHGSPPSFAIEPFTGEVGPRVRLSQLPESSHAVRVVGIDLTGSERRPTGWASIQGGETRTRTVSTDLEIIELTIAEGPQVVSIDAPLSLPEGRTTVYDHDPAFAAGISREAERILWNRRVATYPSLIRSMQELTARGIRLAEKFRELGIPVIESFPGAMQDIMGMPRKGVSRDFLKQSLVEYGLSGEFVGMDISHDELDAISSAIVGQMFWAGYFEELGNDAEDYMIVPSTTRRPPGMRVIGLSGRTASGKSTFASMMLGEGVSAVSYSDVIRSEWPGLRKRSDLRQKGAEVHSSLGQRWLGKRLLRDVESTQVLVVDGLRYPEDHAFWSERFGPRFRHIHLEASDEVRRKRFINRVGSDIDFEAAEQAPTEQHHLKMSALAHTLVDNSGDLLGLRERVIAISREVEGSD
ncbi:ribonuclease H-like domain-containing protein [Schumannella luteola]